MGRLTVDPRRNVSHHQSTCSQRSSSGALHLKLGPLPDPSLADSIKELFAEITDLGTIEPIGAQPDASGIFNFKVETKTSQDELLDLFTFHVSKEHVVFAPFGAPAAESKAAPASTENLGYGFFDDAPGMPSTAASAAPAEAAPASTASSKDPGYGFFDNAPGSPVPSAPSE